MPMQSMPILQPQSYEPKRLQNYLSKQKQEYSWFGSLPLIVFSFVSYLSNCVVCYHFLWLGRESYWLTCLPQYPPLWHAHTSLPTKRISLPSLPGFYCTNSRTTETPKWYNPITLLHIRVYAGTSTVYPKQLSGPGRLFKPLPAANLRDTFPASCALLRV